MNITIILPAVHVTSKRQQRDESPQPTTPFPPISITPSPTPFSEITSYNPEDYKDIIEEYNRELAENHLSKSRAEIVARQAAYEDIQISRSASGTPGTVISARGKSSSESPPLVKAKSSGSAPCPYCSSDSKSEPSLKLLPEKSDVVNNAERRGSNTVSPNNDNDIIRGATATSMSIDRNTESPSSVDTVNTVIQSKAFDILGNLKKNEDIGSTLDDSFESLGNDLCQEDEVLQQVEEQQKPNQEQTNLKEPNISTKDEDEEENGLYLDSTDSITTATIITTAVTTSTVTATETTKSIMAEAIHQASSSPAQAEERNLDFLYEQEEEDDLNLEDDIGNMKDLSLFSYDETIEQIPLDDKPSVAAAATTEERRDTLSPLQDLMLANVPERKVETPTRQETPDSLGRSSSSLSVERYEKPPPPPPQHQQQPPPAAVEIDYEKIIQRQEQKVQQQEHEESALQKHEQHLKEKQNQQQQKQDVNNVKVEQQEVRAQGGDDTLLNQEEVVKEQGKVEHENETVITETTTKEESKNDEVSLVQGQNQISEETINQEEDKQEEIEVVEKKVPVTEETGNDEVTIIVTQDDMPPANMFDSDDENDLEANEISTENNFDESFVENTKTEEKPTSDKGETETDLEYQPDAMYLSDSKSDYYEEEITKVIHEDALKASDSAYYGSHHEFNESYYNLEKIEDNFTRASYEEQSDDKGYDVSERSYEISDKSDHYEKDFENESGYEDFDRSYQDNTSHSYRSHNHYDIIHEHHHHHSHHYSPLSHIEEGKIHRQHTLADIPLLPLKKGPMSIKKQKTEDFTSSSQQVPMLLKKKPKPYPDPRKPAVYPQRLNKTTLARQALAREKRRIYVEERIQNFMRNTKSIQTPYGSLDRSFSIDRSNHHHKMMNASTYSMSKLMNDAKRYEKLQLNPSRQPPECLTGYRKSKMESPQSLPDISIIDYYMTPSRGILTSTPVSSNLGGGKISTHKSHLSSSMSSIRSPTIGIAEVSVVSGGRGSCSTGGAGVSGATAGGGSTTSRSGIVIDSIPEETSDFWKAISSEEGYFYTFRVRQTGPVQMVDKAVQTQTGPMNFSKDFYTSYPRKRAPPLINKSSTITLPLIDNRDKILREIAETVQLRHDAELRRAELIQRANDLQTLIKEKRDKINRRHEFWHKKYIEESSMTRPLEAACNSLRAELNTVHRRLLAHLEGRDLPLRLRDGPSKKANYKIMAARLQHEIKELQQKAKAAKLRLESEIKLKEQAEREVRELRNDLAHKKVIMSLARSQIAALPTVHPRGYDPLGY